MVKLNSKDLFIRALYFVIVLCVEFIIAQIITGDHYILLFVIYIACAIIGMLLKNQIKSAEVKVSNLGWGLMYASITSILLLIALIILASFISF